MLATIMGAEIRPWLTSRTSCYNTISDSPSLQVDQLNGYNETVRVEYTFLHVLVSRKQAHLTTPIPPHYPGNFPPEHANGL